MSRDPYQVVKQELILAIVLGGGSPGLEAMLDRFWAGLSEGGAEMDTCLVDPATDEQRLSELVTQAQAAAGIVLAMGEPSARADATLDRLNDVALRTLPDFERVGVFSDTVATALVALPAADSRLRPAIDVLNGRLYDWGAVVVSPGFAQRRVNGWFDNRPGAVDEAGALTPAGSRSLERHGRRMARVAGLLNVALYP